MNVLDRIIGAVSPEAGLRRARARAALALVRDYDGATKGRRGASLRGRGTSANTEIGPALSALRDRARDFARNTPHGARMLDVLVSHAVGTGIGVVWDTGSDRTDRIVRSAWEEWQARADIVGGGFAGLQALALRSTIEGGDCLLRFLDLPMTADRRVPLAIQGLEGDHIDESRDGVGYGADRATRLGVRLGDYDRPVSYWVRPTHPGEIALSTGWPLSVEVPAADCIHLFRRQRFGQVRGVSWLAPLLLTARDHADLMEAMIVKAKIEACFSAFVTQAQGSAAALLGAGQTQTSDAERIERIKPGMIAYLKDGEDVKFAAPSGSGQFEAVSISTLQAMAVGIGQTYDQLTGDLRQANYSSLRAGKIEQRRLIEQIQWLMLAPIVMDPTLARFVDRAILAGVLAGRRQGYRYRLVMPAVEPIDPLKDLEADILAVRSGRMTPQEFTAGWGVDWRDNIEAFRQWFAAVDAGAMVFDIDPRRTTQTGAASGYATDSGQTK
jgi:lambda family phage portal protein